MLLTLKIRKTLHTLRMMREHCTRVKMDIKINFKAGITNRGGSPNAWEQRTDPH